MKPKRTILCVDDNEQSLSHRKVVLETRGYRVASFSRGQEALERFVAREPLRRVHECVFGVLALESEPVDPRL